MKHGGKAVLADDDLPYTTLTYANGPGAVENPRQNLTGVPTGKFKS